MTEKMRKILQKMPPLVREAYIAEWQKQREIDKKAMIDADLKYSAAVWNAFCIAMHREYGFSTKRLTRALEEAWSIIDSAAESGDSLTGWGNVRDMAREEAGIEVCLDDVGGGADSIGKTKIEFRRKK